MSRPHRSALYIPGSKPRALDKARGLPVDVILFDLEDAVTPAEKIVARTTLAEELGKGGYGTRLRVVRINGLDTQWGKEDAAAADKMECDAVLLPKVNSAADVDALAALTDKPIWAMMETPLGILNALEIAAHPKIKGFVLGTNDLAKDLNTRNRADREPLLTSLQLCLLAARAHGVVAVDGVYNAFKDEEGFKVECEQGRDMGFDGKTLIHPAQVDAANAAFAPTADEIDLAERQIAAFAEAEAAGQGVAVVDGKIVENLHIVTARATLAKAAAIAELESQ
ncbi:CoA ester lyase [Octadecabacter sp. 1_MG-2023]|uniref:HpcH/HpaI aldolase/citrate lyase family protein n=1 Tax=unclassified Octadecabacter TaxID=196158 RepID=UPI001C0924CE|nr:MULTISPECIES: CoA ester lyase [unclassified Octadecabacter]MBU2991775.1 CoA ester lyase [Octadecabacter sp. B2R22]MDO6735748.1 CoA ester lyase [Octadecabacter sp. 1_MG-2023]